MMLNLSRIERVKRRGHSWYFLDSGVIVSMNPIRLTYTVKRGKVLLSQTHWRGSRPTYVRNDRVKGRVIVLERVMACG